MTETLRGPQEYWDRHAASDPLWAVLTFPDKSGGRWTLDEFMKNGEREIALLFHRFAELRLSTPDQRGLDFGCGVGRVTQALARRMTHVVGADISPMMIEHARRLNRYPGRAEYFCTATTGLDTLPSRSFQCIYSNMVLQHIAPEISIHYLDEFFRLLQPEGLLVFQLPSHPHSPVDTVITAMPDDAYRASIELAAPAPASVEAASPVALTLKVRNAGAHEWRQPKVGPLALGNHWLDDRGELMVIQDDGRSPLLQIVPPGLEWPVLLTMHAPAEPGRYVCEIDLVHEGITWFAGRGVPTLRFPVDVTRASGDVADTSRSPMIKEFPVPEYPESALPRPAPSSTTPVGDFPMHGVPSEQVLQIIRRHRARLAFLEEDQRAGPEWASFRYFVVCAS